MSIALPAFTPIDETLYLTLCGRALDNHLPHPILGDTMAEELVGKLGYDCGRFRLTASPILNIAHRAKKLDQVAQQFIARHPNAVGLDLGAGLDTRMVRIAPPPRSTGTTSTTPRSSPPDSSCSRPGPTPTTSPPT
jgi:O-methyltransferase involved in polyketide biosynthesis